MGPLLNFHSGLLQGLVIGEGIVAALLLVALVVLLVYQVKKRGEETFEKRDN